jgi:hypothetical protein
VLAPAAPWRPWAGETNAHGKPPELFAHRGDVPSFRRETREQAAAKRRMALRRQLAPDRQDVRRPPVTAATKRKPDVA